MHTARTRNAQKSAGDIGSPRRFVFALLSFGAREEYTDGRTANPLGSVTTTAYNFLVFSSVTYALKAQGVLERAGIRSRLEKLKKEQSLRGCGYGLKIRNADILEAQNVLDRERIKILEIYSA